ncbi:MAG: hypothetical protein LBJ57_08575, partial [Prevotellaceae bacterium]|nr:hypothetical protein [Prevotellaceae bacterium]
TTATAAKAATTTEATTATKANAKKKRREPRAWYIADGVKIPLEEFLKDEPKYTGISRLDVLKKQGRYPLITKILDMRAVMK